MLLVQFVRASRCTRILLAASSSSLPLTPIIIISARDRFFAIACVDAFFILFIFVS